jgi:hypothetical protein
MKALVTLLAATALFAACRQGDPEPKMPPNSPIPEIDRPKDQSSSGGDAGAGLPVDPRPRAAR